MLHNDGETLDEVLGVGLGRRFVSPMTAPFDFHRGSCSLEKISIHQIEHHIRLDRRIMRRRIVQRVGHRATHLATSYSLVQGQNICFFCSLRLAIESSPAPLQSLRGVRYLHRNASLQRPGAAQAAQRDDDDDIPPQSGARYTTNKPDGKGVFRGFDAFETVSGNERSQSSTRQRAPARTQTPRQPDRFQGRFGQSEPVRQRTSFQGQDTSRAPAQQSDPNAVWRSLVRPPREPVSTTTREQGPTSTSGAWQPPYGDPRPNPREPYSKQGQYPGAALRDVFAGSNRPEGGDYRNRFPNQRQGDMRNGRDSFGERRQYPSPYNRDTPFRQGRQPYNGRARQDFGEPRPNTSENGQRPFRPIMQPPTEDSPRTVAEDDADDADEFSIGHHRRGQKQPDSREERRNRRWATEGEDDSDVSSKKKKSWKSKARDPNEELEDQIEAMLEGREVKPKKKPGKAAPTQRSRPKIEIPEYMSVQNLARALDVRATAFMRRLKQEGYDDILHDHIFDQSTAAIIAELYGTEPILTDSQAYKDLLPRQHAPDLSVLPPRPPIVTIMGHVDHGKTTILDYLRKSSVVASEHGGITQHIGAFSVTMPVTNRQITFLDTPGHAAFLDMRRRGAVVTDIVVLVVAADDSVKPQTIEAIKHAMDAKVQIIVAINKIDKEDADVQKVWQDLGRHDIHVEGYGGDIQAIPLSGKTGEGMDALEEAIVTQADVSDFRAEVEGPAEGWIIESKVISSGRTATVLVRRGTLRLGDYIVAGNTWARVRTLHNDAGQSVDEALPGTPVQVDGWRGEDPTAGLEVLQANDEHHAKRVVDYRLQQAENIRAATDMLAINKTKTAEAEAYAKVYEWRQEMGFVGRRTRRRPQANEGWVENAAESGPTRIPFVIKADVAGSAEAIDAAVSAIANAEVVADVILAGTGQVSESDIKLLATTGDVGYAISFNQAIDAGMYRLAEAANVKILDHNIIYKVTDDVKAKLEDELDPIISQRVHGEAEVGQIFDITVKKSKIKVAGCRVTNGTISKSRKIRVLRGQETLYTGKSLLRGPLTSRLTTSKVPWKPSRTSKKTLPRCGKAASVA